MTSFPVLWPYGQRMPCWDQALITAAIRGELWPMPVAFEEVNGPIEAGVVIASGTLCATGGPIELPPGWCLLIHTSDESHQWDSERLRRPGMKIWQQYLSLSTTADRALALGWPPETRAMLHDVPRLPLALRRPWIFIGQAQTEERKRLVAQLAERADGDLLVTDGFGQGLARADYLAHLASASVAFCPAGTMHPDTFRLYEAFEAGCWPIREIDELECKDGRTPQHQANLALSWWLMEKRRVTCNLVDDCCELSGQPVPVSGIGVTVLLPTSPIPSHPSTAMIEDTIRRIRAYPDLKGAEVLIMVDGVRTEQEHWRTDYEEYTRRLIDLCNWHPDFRGCLPIVFDQHLHQGVMTRRTLPLVRTPLIFFCEHDMWPEGEIDFAGLAHAMQTHEEVKVIRLYRDAEMHSSHRDMVLDSTRHDVAGVPLARTTQWSQNPHLAKTEFYRDIIPRYFGHESRTMIEDVLHGAVVNAGREGWSRWGLWLYAPEPLGGNIRRCGFVDGRQDDPKFPMLIAYDHGPITGAPPEGIS